MNTKFKVGQVWVSRGGDTFSIIGVYNLDNKFPVVAKNNDTGVTGDFTSDGFKYENSQSSDDLLELVENFDKKQKEVNIDALISEFSRKNRVSASKLKFLIDSVNIINKKEKSDDMCIVCRIREKKANENNNRHKYADVIHAYAEGAQIQYKMDDYDWTDTTAPCFGATNIEFRIKPKTRIERYRMALTSNGVLSVNVTNSSLDNPAEYEVQGFIKWLGDIVKVEVNE